MEPAHKNEKLIPPKRRMIKIYGNDTKSALRHKSKRY